MLEIEIEGREHAPGAPADAELEAGLTAAFRARGIESGHVALHFVDEQRSHELASAYLGKSDATDVISFPVDGEDDDFPVPAEDADAPPPRELGDIVICASRTVDLLEATVHGALHLTGMDHETDDGEMLALQDELMAALRG